LIAFSERQHIETSSCHLPIGEITITFNDVAYFLHLPNGGKLLLRKNLNKEKGDLIFG